MRAFAMIALLIALFLMFMSYTYRNINLTPLTPPVEAQASNLSLMDILATPAPAVQGALVNQPGVPVTGAAAVECVYPTPALNSIPVTGTCPPVSAIPITGGCTTGCAYYYPGTVLYPSIPVTGGCPNPYMVQYGDTLSRLARACGTNVPALLTLNPYIYNPNLIFPGQVLWIYPPGGSGVPVTGPVVAPTPVPVQVNPIVLTPSVTPITGGSSLQVTVNNFPPNTPVNIGIGKFGMGYQIVNAGITDASGTLVTSIILPQVDNPLDQWNVVVITTSGTPVHAASQPFNITQ
jgi:hypothetical protein